MQITTRQALPEDLDNILLLFKETIESIGVEFPGYIANDVFYKMGLKTFSDLTPILQDWSDAVS